MQGGYKTISCFFKNILFNRQQWICILLMVQPDPTFFQERTLKIKLESMLRGLLILFIGLIGTTLSFAQQYETGYSLGFDGKDDFIQLNRPLVIDSSSATIELWMQVPQVTPGVLGSNDRVGIIVGNYAPRDKNTYNLEIYKNGKAHIFWAQGEINAFGNTDLRDGAWHHLAFVRDKENNKFFFYIDGRLDLEVNSAGRDLKNAKAPRIGGDLRNGTGGPSLHGQMDDFRVWNIPLKKKQLMFTMENLITESHNDYEHFITYFNFDAHGGYLADNRGTNNGELMHFLKVKKSEEEDPQEELPVAHKKNAPALPEDQSSKVSSTEQ